MICRTVRAKTKSTTVLRSSYNGFIFDSFTAVKEGISQDKNEIRSQTQTSFKSLSGNSAVKRAKVHKNSDPQSVVNTFLIKRCIKRTHGT